MHNKDYCVWYKYAVYEFKFLFTVWSVHMHYRYLLFYYFSFEYCLNVQV